MSKTLIYRVNFLTENVPSVNKCKDIDGKQGKSVKLHFYEKKINEKNNFYPIS